LATPRKRWFKVADAILREDWTPETRGIVVGLMAWLHQRWSRDGITAEEAGHALISAADAMLITGDRRPHIAVQRLSTLPVHAGLSGATASVERTKGGSSVRLSWPNFAIFQDLDSRSSGSRRGVTGPQVALSETETEKKKEEAPSETAAPSLRNVERGEQSGSCRPPAHDAEPDLDALRSSGGASPVTPQRSGAGDARTPGANTARPDSASGFALESESLSGSGAGGLRGRARASGAQQPGRSSNITPTTPSRPSSSGSAGDATFRSTEPNVDRPSPLLNLLARERGSAEAKRAWLEAELPLIEAEAERMEPHDEKARRAAVKTLVFRYWRARNGTPRVEIGSTPHTRTRDAARALMNRLHGPLTSDQPAGGSAAAGARGAAGTVTSGAAGGES
jgi:hypothetical protein